MFPTLFLSALLIGCVEDVSKDKAEATVAEAKKVDTTAPKGEVLKVDASKSTIKALGAKITATHPVDFHDFSGELAVADGKLTKVEFTVQMATLESDHPKLTEHLKNEDFFDVSGHPTSTFVSTKIEQDGAKATVEGNLTIRGNTKSVTFPADVKIADGTVEAKTEFAIDRQDFAIVYPGKPDDLIQDKVVLTIELVAHK